jgi:hypothetical protein
MKRKSSLVTDFFERFVTHGPVAMLAVVGFLVSEAVEGSLFLFHAQVLPLPTSTFILVTFIVPADQTLCYLSQSPA